MTTPGSGWTTTPGQALGGGASAVNVPTTTETAVLTIPPGNAQQVNAANGNGAIISGSLVLVPGTAATSVQIRIRRGSGTGGASLGPAVVIPVTAGVVAAIPFSFFDSAFGVLGALGPWAMQYTVTLQQAAATGNGTVTLIAAIVTPSMVSF